jgi:uncharacterized protein (DUF1684 family)
MKKTLLIISILFVTLIYSQESKAVKSALKYQSKLNKEFASKEDSPLTEEDLKNFKSLEFFPVDTNFIVKAKLEYKSDSKPFKMKTTTDRLPVYKLYAIATFKIKDVEYKLHIYQNEKLILTAEYIDYLFLPFTDNTNANTTYGGGRYIDLKIPEGETVIIDFNKSYNPYCAYNGKYSCPIPPKVNDLNIEINAGVKAYGEH